MSVYAVLILAIVIATTVMAFYWYLKHRQIDLLLRRYEGEHYGVARSRLSRVAAQEGAIDDASSPRPISALPQRRMRGLIGDTPAEQQERHAAHR